MSPRLPQTLALILLLASQATAVRAQAPAGAAVEELLRDPTPAEWASLARYDQTLTRRDFEGRLDRVFDPDRAMRAYLRLDDGAVSVLAAPDRGGAALVVVRFARSATGERPPQGSFRPPAVFGRGAAGGPGTGGGPLQGLRVAIEPADIGGRWAVREDRSVEFPGFGRINEGDINLVVGRLLRDRLIALGASVFLVRDGHEPMVPVRPESLGALAADVMRNRPWLLPESYRLQAAALPAGSPRRLRIAEDLLLTKTIETRARALLVRRSFAPDITIVLQHNATAASGGGRLNPVNRNIFFVNGAYSAAELAEPEQRFRLLGKLLGNTTPVEAGVAAAIAGRFRSANGSPLPRHNPPAISSRTGLPRKNHNCHRNPP